MGEQSVRRGLKGDARRDFVNHLLEDLSALERMESEGLLAEGVRRIGAEQELFLVDRSCHPVPKAMEILAKLQDPHFAHELASFNLEINLDPLEFSTDCLRHLHNSLEAHLGRLREVANECGTDLVLAGILPTIRRSDLGLDSMTPKDRYAALNEAFMCMRSTEHRVHIKGLDELSIVCNSVMLEAANASWQVHFQVDAEDFPNMYNAAQLSLGPVLAAAVNSPILFGRRLWHETRAAVFQQALDTRPANRDPMDRMARVSFGRQWVKKSVLEIYHEDVTRFRALVGASFNEAPLALLDAGEIPLLRSLRVHNSTVYRWNRPCYGMLNGKPHLRIENRILPSGPSVLDEIANATFWYGLLLHLNEVHPQVSQEFAFEDARSNFQAAAHQGLQAQFHWFDGKTVPAQALICDELLPGCHDALVKAGIDQEDVERYLGVIEERVRSGINGAEWMLRSYKSFPTAAKPGTRACALVAAMIARQQTALPVAQWELAQIEEAGAWEPRIHRVEDYMSTDLYIVRVDEPVKLVASMMVWKHIRHVPVEDEDRNLVGLVSYRRLLRVIVDGEDTSEVTVGAIMKQKPLTVAPDVTAMQAIELMESQQIDCLPVVRDGRLVGILTDRDFVAVARRLLRDSLGKPIA